VSKRQTFRPNWPRFSKKTYSYNPASRKGNLLALSGMMSTDTDTGKILWPRDIIAQTRQVYENIKAVLESAGATFDDVVKTCEYITPAALPNYKATADVRREYFKDNFPAATGVVVNRLLRDEALIEVDVLAVLD
jgi:2-iminobutanoate/2-iminopropanoate deaminase